MYIIRISEVAYWEDKMILVLVHMKSMNNRNKYLDQRFPGGVKAPPLPLPFFHSCDAESLQGILKKGYLRPNPCTEYNNEKLLYLYYGKPAYKSSEKSNSRLDFLLPVVFFINYDAVRAIKRAMAFDSGAWHLYKPYVHKSMKREEFELTPEKESLIKMVEFFYGSNELYFVGDPKTSLEYDSFHHQIKVVHSVIKGDQKMELDDRKGAFEVQLAYPIPLNKNTIEAIILPSHLNDSAIISGILKKKGIRTIPIINYGVKSDAYYVHIMEIVREHLIKKNLFA